jgi:hypothetical protein
MKLNQIKSLPWIKAYLAGKRLLDDVVYQEAQQKTVLERQKQPKRTEVINFLLSTRAEKTCYLEIGVRNPNNNFNQIVADQKYSVDPGLEFKENPVDFQMTSDEFFASLEQGRVLSPSVRFDVIFIDGLHLADQVHRDVVNALTFLKDDGFVVLHDCNPPTEWHARENFYFHNTPAADVWNGTVWKAFLRWRFNSTVQSCCVDSDWGIGVLSKSHLIGAAVPEANPFFEYKQLSDHRKYYLNLMSFDEFKSLFA